MTAFTIEVISDITCPFCFVGKRKLEQAIGLWKKAYGESSDSFSITWRAYYLVPDALPGEATTEDYIKQKTGMSDITPVVMQLERLGKANRIQFKLGGKTGSTRDAHRLIYLAQTRLLHAKICDVLVEGLFHGHHECAQDISSHDILHRIAVEAGIDAAEANAWLRSDIAGTDVDREFSEAKQQGISGVPVFIIQGRYILRGAQDVPAFIDIFSEARNNTAK